jgi:hypothetical protein
MRLEVSDCGEALSGEGLQQALGVELRGAGPEVLSYIERARPRGLVQCRGDKVVIKVATDDGVEFRETVEADRLGLARFIAIAIVESMVAQTREPDEAPPEPVTKTPPPALSPPSRGRPEPAPPDDQAVEPSSDVRTSGLWLNALGGAQGSGRPAWWSGRGELTLDLVTSGLFTFGLGASASRGALEPVEGSIQATTGSAALLARVGKAFLPLRLEAGFGVRGGIVHWEGTPSRPDLVGTSGTAPWGGPLVELLLATHVTRNVRLLLGAEGGITLVSAVASRGDTILAELAPVWFTAKLGLGLRLAP